MLEEWRSLHRQALCKNQLTLLAVEVNSCSKLDVETESSLRAMCFSVTTVGSRRALDVSDGVLLGFEAGAVWDRGASTVLPGRSQDLGDLLGCLFPSRLQAQR